MINLRDARVTDDLTSFKNQIFIYGIIVAAIFELASLSMLGIDARFFYGLSLGTAIAIVNFNLMALTFRLMLEMKKSAVAFLGYLVRIAIYGGTFYLSLQVGLISALGTALGFLTIKLALLYLHGLKAKFSKGRILREEPEELKPKKHWYDYKENDDYDDD